MLTWRSALLGLLAGVVAGALMQAAPPIIDLWRHFRGADWFAAESLRFAALHAVVNLPVWAIVLTLFGALPWLAIPPLRRGGPVKLMIVGGALAMLAYAALATDGFGIWLRSDYSAADGDGPTWLHGALTPHGWRAMAFYVALYGLSTAASILIAWRVAHPVPQPKDAHPATRS